MTEHGRTEKKTDLERYYTPKWVTKSFLEYISLSSPYSSLSDVDKIAEPCAGQGWIVDVLEDEGFEVIAGDVDPESPYDYVDATDKQQITEAYSDCDLILTNPPYNADTGTASEVIEVLLTLDIPLIALLRITYLEPCDDRPHLLKGLDRVVTYPRFDFHCVDKEDSNGNPATSCWMMWNLGLDNNYLEQYILSKQDVSDLLQTTIFD